jgi:hypothetical protein
VTARLVCAAFLLAACGGGGAAPDAHEAPDAAAPDANGTCAHESDCDDLTAGCLRGTCVDGTCTTVAVADLTGCEDGSFCTVGDTCAAGVCQPGHARACDSPDPCHVGVCDEAADACTSVAGNDGATCFGTDDCVVSMVCQAGDCVGGASIDCTFLDDACNVGVCQTGAGCVAQAANEGGTCSDGLFCTAVDTCQSGACVAGGPPDCVPAGTQCQVSTCDEDADSCTAVNGGDGTTCDDGNLCTAGETCSTGACGGGTPANNGALCDDHDACTAGTTCGTGVCGSPQSTITACAKGDGCCPAGCSQSNDDDCLWWQSGIQQNVPPATLVGWSQCWAGTYATDGDSLSAILATCAGSKLLMACRPVGSPNFALVAMGDRADVLFDCGSNLSCLHAANGVGWYYNSDWSWGFAPPGDTVARNQCDTNGPPDADKRMCWHTFTGTIGFGYRCGDNNLNGDAGWQRLLFTAP